MSFERLIELREDAVWAIDWAISHGLSKEAKRYYKIMNRIEDWMRSK